MGSRLEANSSAIRKRIESHSFKDEGGDEYSSSSFGGFRDYFRRKKIKLQNRDAEMRERGRALALQNQSSPSSKEPRFNPNIFRGVVAHITGYTQPSLADLHRLIVTHGGGYLQYLDGKTAATHIIASSLTPKKRVEFRRYRIVKPAWVVESVKAGKLLPWDDYRVIGGDGVGAGQKFLGRADGGKIVNASEQNENKGNWLRRGGGYRDQTDASWYTKKLLRGDASVDTSTASKSDHDLAFEDDKDSCGDMVAEEAIKSNAEDLGRSEERESIDDFAVSSAILEEVNDEYCDNEPLHRVSTENALSTDIFQMEDSVNIGEAFNEDEYESLNEVDLQKEAILLEQGHFVSPFVTPTKLKDVTVASRLQTKEDPVNDMKKQAHENGNSDDLAPLVLKGRADPLPITSDYRAQYTGEDPSPARHFPNGQAAQTAEEHNAIILADPRIRKSTAANPDFLEQYYRESRLHHLSTWKADLKARMQSRAAEQSASQQASSRQRQTSVLAAAKDRRYVLHVDFDSFFAAVSLTKHPELQDKPAVVAHGRGSGSEIASCNYPARTFGIKNGMWMRAAQELCPDLHILPYDFPAYEKASEAFYSAILCVEGGIVQSVSIDEALVDITVPCVEAGVARIKYLAGNKSLHLDESEQDEEERIDAEQAQADDIAYSLRSQVRRETGCNVSVGIGGNILLAKVALRKAKPAGQYHLKPENVLEYIGNLFLQDLPGVAWSIGGKLEALIRDGKTGHSGKESTGDVNEPAKIRDLRAITLPKLTNVLGPKTGTRIYEHARGIDRAAVGSHQQPSRKSVSAEVNWGIRFATQAQADDFIRNLCGEVGRRLTKEGVKGRQLTVKMMRRAQDAPLAPPKHLGHGRCDVFSKSVALGVATRDGERIAREALGIMRGFKCPPGELRGIGVQVTRLEMLGGNAGGDRGGGNVGMYDGNQYESSQKKLHFRKTEEPKRISLIENADNGGDKGFIKKAQVPIPHFSLSPLGPLSQQKKSQKRAKDEDPIEDEPEQHQYQHQHQVIDAMNDDGLDDDSPARKPLNTLGTQFLMPTQVDPSVLAELPYDVRAKLSRRSQNISNDENAANTNRNTPNNKTGLDNNEDSKIASNEYRNAFSALPTHSQLDPEVLAALPAEVRTEILSEYELRQPTKQIKPATTNNTFNASTCRSPTPSVYTSAYATSNMSPLSATTSISAPKTPSSSTSALRKSFRHVSRQRRSQGRSAASARALEGSPSPSPRGAANANAVTGNSFASKGRLQLLPPLISTSTTSTVVSGGSDATTLARPRSAASNSNSGNGVTTGIGTGTGGSSGNGSGKGAIKARGSTRGRPRGRPPGIRARPMSRSLPSGFNNANDGATSNINRNNSIKHSYYNNDGDTSHATLTLTQANFIPSHRNRDRNGTDTSMARIGSGDESGDTDGNGIIDDALDRNTSKNENEISPDFLAALPPDLRAEVLHQHRHHQRRVGRPRTAPAPAPAPVNFTSNNYKHDPKNTVNKRVLHLHRQPPKPTFSTRHLTEPGDLRAAIKDWYAAFRDEGGPYREDVYALVGYLRRVVGGNGNGNGNGEAIGEGNMAKATSLVRWLEWVVEDGEVEAHQRNQSLSASASASASASFSPPSSSKSIFTSSSSPAKAAAATATAAAAAAAVPLSLSFSSLSSSFLASPPDLTKQRGGRRSLQDGVHRDVKSTSKSESESNDCNHNHNTTTITDPILPHCQNTAASPPPLPGKTLAVAAAQPSKTESQENDLIIPWPLAVQRVKTEVEEAIARRVSKG